MKPARNPLAAIAAVIAVVALALTVSACGEKAEPTIPDDVRPDKINLMLDWLPNANHAGIYMGIEHDAFKKRALVVAPQVPPEGAGVIEQVEAGRVDLGVTYASWLLQAQDKGAKVKAIAALVNVPLNSLIWLKKSGIRSVKGLRGKTVAVSGDDNSSALETILKTNNVPVSSVKQVNVGYKLQQILVAGRADASITGYWNVEGVELERAGLKPTVIPVDKAGSPTYNELVIVASTEHLEDGRRAETYRRFIAGLEEGTELAVDDPEGALEALAVEAPELTRSRKTRAAALASLKVTLPILAQDDRGENPFGWLDPTIWANYGKWMRDNGELQTSGTTYTDVITNDLLPGQVPVPAPEDPNDRDGGLKVD